MFKRGLSAFVLLIFLAAGGCGDDVTRIKDAPAPVAKDDSYQIFVDNVLREPAPGVMANDLGANSDMLLVVGYDSTALSGGTVDISSDGAFTYTPPVGFSGIDRFEYLIFDGRKFSTGIVQLTVEPVPLLSPLHKRLASDPQTGGNRFGEKVSVSGDYAIIGAPYEDTFGSRAGAAYLFYRNRGGANMWGEVAKLTASDAKASDLFGISVSIDGPNAVVGARGYSYGAVYLFHRDEGGSDNWVEVTKIDAPSTNAYYFGYSVAISGENILVGAPYDENANGSRPGAAYLFQRDQGGADNWGQVAKLSGSGSDEGDIFGDSVAISGDDVLIGAPDSDTDGVFYAGAAYLFHRNQGGTDNWGEVAKLTALVLGESDLFGCSVSINDDHAAIGAYGDSANGLGSGAAYIFNRAGGDAGSWERAARVSAPDGQAFEYFGTSVSISGDHLLVGTPGYSTGGVSIGAVYHFHRHKGGFGNWGAADKLTGYDSQPSDSFGSAVAISDGSAIVGVPSQETGGSHAGAVYFFSAVEAGRR